LANFEFSFILIKLVSSFAFLYYSTGLQFGSAECKNAEYFFLLSYLVMLSPDYMVLMVRRIDYEVVEWQWQEKTKILGENVSLFYCFIYNPTWSGT